MGLALFFCIRIWWLSLLCDPLMSQEDYDDAVAKQREAWKDRIAYWAKKDVDQVELEKSTEKKYQEDLAAFYRGESKFPPARTIFFPWNDELRNEKESFEYIDHNLRQFATFDIFHDGRVTKPKIKW